MTRDTKSVPEEKLRHAVDKLLALKIAAKQESSI